MKYRIVQDINGYVLMQCKFRWFPFWFVPLLNLTGVIVVLGNSLDNARYRLIGFSKRRCKVENILIDDFRPFDFIDRDGETRIVYIDPKDFTTNHID